MDHNYNHSKQGYIRENCPNIKLYQTHSSSTLDLKIFTISSLLHVFIRFLFSSFSGRGPTVAMQAPADIASVPTSMLLELQGNDHDAAVHEPIGNDSLSKNPKRYVWQDVF